MKAFWAIIGLLAVLAGALTLTGGGDDGSSVALDDAGAGAAPSTSTSANARPAPERPATTRPPRTDRPDRPTTDRPQPAPDAGPPPVDVPTDPAPQVPPTEIVTDAETPEIPDAIETPSVPDDVATDVTDDGTTPAVDDPAPVEVVDVSSVPDAPVDAAGMDEAEVETAIADAVEVALVTLAAEAAEAAPSGGAPLRITATPRNDERPLDDLDLALRAAAERGDPGSPHEGHNPFAMPDPGAGSALFPGATDFGALAEDDADAPALEFVRNDDGTFNVGTYQVTGSGTDADPFVMPWGLLVSAKRVYKPRVGMTDLPEWAELVSNKHVRVTGYLLFPLWGDDADEVMVMKNQWDGCCIGVPPTPYDAIEVRLGEHIDKNKRWQLSHGTLAGKLLVDPYLVDGWLVGLYLMEDAVLEAGDSLGGGAGGF